jgi:hypothetical protein
MGLNFPGVYDSDYRLHITDIVFKRFDIKALAVRMGDSLSQHWKIRYFAPFAQPSVRSM